MTENYVFHDLGLLGGGVRFMSGDLSVDVGLVSPIWVGEFIALPMVNFVKRF